MGYARFLVAAALFATAVPAAAAPIAPPTRPPAEALILVPLTLTKIDDLEFGSVLPSAVSGTVTINAASGARSFTGGVTGLPSDVGQRAYFAGAGSPSQQVIVTMVPPVQLTSTTNPADTIPVLGLTLEGSPFKTIDPVNRTFFFSVGGTIQVNGDQPEGLYEATFDVTATYL